MFNELEEYGNVLLFLAGAMLFLGGGLAAAWLIRPSKPDSQKLSSYESGEEAVGSPWGAFHIRFYVIALIFVLFEDINQKYAPAQQTGKPLPLRQKP
jgi:NADH-quinone oxidoreductase subunit A